MIPPDGGAENGHYSTRRSRGQRLLSQRGGFKGWVEEDKEDTRGLGSMRLSRLLVLDKRSKSKQLKDTIDEIPTPTNKFQALSSAPEELETVTKTRVTIKNKGRTTQVFAASKEVHTALRELFVKNNLLYHTYAFKGERRKKWVIHGLTTSAPVGEILEDVRQTIPGAVQVIQMTKTDGDGRKRVLPTFILITNAGVTQKEFKNLVIYSHYVQVQKYTTEEAVTQCYRCQLFGHSSRYCNLQQKCVRCAGNHRASECDREKIKPKCANCNEAHSLNMALKTMTYNARGLQRQLSEIIDIIVDNRVDVVLLTETHLREAHKPYIPGFTIHRKDRGTSGGGVAILVKNEIRHRQIMVPSSEMEIIGMQVNAGTRPVNFYSVYKPPDTKLDCDVLHDILSEPQVTVVAGDFNAKHTFWNCSGKNTAGTTLCKFIEANRHVHLSVPTEFTHFPDNENSPSTLDLVLTNRGPKKPEQECSTQDRQTTSQFTSRESLNDATSTAKPALTTDQDIDDAVEKFTSDIVSSLRISVPKKSTIIKPPVLPDEIKHLISTENRVRRRYFAGVHKEAAERKGFEEEKVKSRVKQTMEAAGQDERTTAASRRSASGSSNANGKKDSRNNAVARLIDKGITWPRTARMVNAIDSPSPTLDVHEELTWDPENVDLSFLEAAEGESLEPAGLGLLRRRVEEGPDLPANPEAAAHPGAAGRVPCVAGRPPTCHSAPKHRQLHSRAPKITKKKPHKIRTKALSGRPRASHEVCRFAPTCTPHSARRRGPRASPVYVGREGGGRHWALAPPLSMARGGGAVPPPLLYPAAIRHSHYLRYKAPLPPRGQASLAGYCVGEEDLI
ncbi:hypothetical protein AAG570_000950 [Ranatra chinensis]|uniref:Endonuclease/exonuclease/phosphatase domain-containing protein n=1 Tax=Ranatra chinensis TaxID=642074 RepID=A0ABD0YYL2_9HEMI